MRPRFELLPTDLPLAHEEIDAHQVARLIQKIRSTGMVADPIWVAAESYVILNGHHRFYALRTLGVRRVPAWVFDYSDAAMLVDRWSPGPPISKREVVERARSRHLFPPKTTRHRFSFVLPKRPTPLTTLMDLQGPVPIDAAKRSNRVQRVGRRLSREGARSSDSL